MRGVCAMPRRHTHHRGFAVSAASATSRATAEGAVADSHSAQSSASAHRRSRSRAQQNPLPMSWRIVTSALLGAVAGAVVAFGGTEPASFAAVEILLFVLAGCALWIEPREVSRARWLAPALLLAFLACDIAVVHPAAYPARTQLLAVAACLCGFIVAACAAREAEARRSIWSVLIALGLAESLYALVQYMTDWQQILAFKKVVYTAQASGTYINPNNFAGLIEMLLPLVFARTLWEFEQWTANARGSRRRAASWMREDHLPRFAFFLFGTLLLMAALLFSRSRAGIAAAWAGVALVAAVWTVRRRQHSAALAIVIFLVVVTFAGGAWIGLEPVFSRFRSAEQDLPSRVAVWKDTAKLVRAHPYWGSGPGSFEDAYTRVQTSGLTMRLNHAHDDYLEFAAEWGVPATLLLFALVGFVLFRALRRIGRAARSADRFLLLGCCGGLCSMLLHAFVDFNLHIPANALLFAVLAGVACALSAVGANAPDQRAAAR
jgi:O-antigen ligase